MSKFTKLSRAEMKNVMGGVLQGCGDPSLSYQCCTTTYQFLCDEGTGHGGSHAVENGVAHYCTGSNTVCACYAPNCMVP